MCETPSAQKIGTGQISACVRDSPPYFAVQRFFDGAGVQLTAISFETPKAALPAAALLFVLSLVLISFYLGAVPG
jgi:hypothetical protein